MPNGQLQGGVTFLAFLQSNRQKIIEIFSTCLFPIKVKISATAELYPLVVFHIVIFMQDFSFFLFLFFETGSFDHFRFPGTKQKCKWKTSTWAIFPYFSLSPSFYILSALWGSLEQWECKISIQQLQYLIAWQE